MSGPPAPSSRRDLVLLGIVAAGLFLPALGGHDLWNPNEPIYGQAVVEMTERGDWLVPYLNGLVFAEKPILYYWMALLASDLFGGVNELTLRLPSAFAGILSVLFTYLLVLPYVGARRARLAGILLATTHIVFLGSRSAQMDILVEAATLATILAASRVIDHGLSPWTGWSMAGVAAGLGFLAKGPVGWICPGIALFLYLITTRRLRTLLTPAAAVGAAVCLAVSLPWYAMLWARGEVEVLEEVLFRQNFTRFVDPWDHQAPWWYFLLYFWVDMAPWGWFVPMAVALPERTPSERRLDLLAWTWIAGIVVFFSLSQSKRSPYILPIAPAVAILGAAIGERLLDGRLSGWRRRATTTILAVGGLLFAACGVLLAARALPRYPEVRSAILALATTLVAGGLAVAMGFVLRRLRGDSLRGTPAAGFLAALVAFYIVVATVAMPAADAFKSARPFSEKLTSLAEPDDVVLGLGFWKWRAGYTYYLKRPIQIVPTADALRGIWASPRRAFLIVEDSNLTEARKVVGDAPPLVAMGVGGKTAYLFANR